MQAVKGHLLNGRFTPVDNVELPSSVEVVLVFEKSSCQTPKSSEILTPVIRNPKRQLGFLKDKVPTLPSSFFDPLPEKDLQAWGV